MKITEVLRAYRVQPPWARGGARNAKHNGSDAGATRPAQRGGPNAAASPPTDEMVDLKRRRDALNARVAEMQWDLGGLVYEMATRNRIQVELLVKRAAALQDADAELHEIDRILQMDQTGTAGVCPSCGAPHSSGAAYCWQCGQPILEQVSSESVSGA